jgi:hypothetical protein
MTIPWHPITPDIRKRLAESREFVLTCAPPNAHWNPHPEIVRNRITNGDWGFSTPHTHREPTHYAVLNLPGEAATVTEEQADLFVAHLQDAGIGLQLYGDKDEMRVIREAMQKAMGG